jgi:hypothetical protein
MTVIAFTPREQRGEWQAAELEQLVETLSLRPRDCANRGWDVGATELGDPQFYMLGPPPREDCILCISRLGRVYVLEDGAGKVLFEHNSLVMLAEQAKALLQRKKSQIAARIAVAWCALREAFEEKLEPIVGESEELLTHFVPQLAALA